MEIAIPASDIRLAFTPKSFNGMNDRATATGMVTIGMIDEGKCQRKTRMTIETMMISSISLSLTVPIARSIRSERS